MADDIVKRLRNIINFPPDVDIDWRDAVADALDEIEVLRAERNDLLDFIDSMPSGDDAFAAWEEDRRG